MLRIIHVQPGNARTTTDYQVTVRPGVMHRLPVLLARTAKGRSVFVITDDRVARLYGRSLQRGLRARDVSTLLLSFPPGESSKNAATAHNLQTALLVNGIRRNDLVVIVGGGVAGDLGGFVAATVLRGVECVQIPTSLLAQVDSSVGGKVGIDHPFGKNLVGAFHHPSAVFIDPLVLRTLPVRHYRNGLAEVVKIAAALDARFFDWIEAHAEAIRKRDRKITTEMIARAIGLKAAVVGKDPLDAGLRNVLNLGHTIGHAVEAASGYRLLHGEAVSIGLVQEARIACAMGLLASSDADRLVRLLKALQLPADIPDAIDRKAARRALSLDKKGTSLGIRYVLLKAIGKCVIGMPVPADRVDAVLGR